MSMTLGVIIVQRRTVVRPFTYLELIFFFLYVRVVRLISAIFKLKIMITMACALMLDHLSGAMACQFLFNVISLPVLVIMVGFTLDRLICWCYITQAIYF